MDAMDNDACIGERSIITVCNLGDHDDASRYFYSEITKKNIEKCFPNGFMEMVGNPDTCQGALEYFDKKIPIIIHSELSDEAPDVVSFFMVCSYRKNAFKFFYEMVSQWLVPGHQLNVMLLFAYDFSFSCDPDKMYIACDMKIRLETLRELEVMKDNIFLIEQELRFGITSEYRGRKVLELKCLSVERKKELVKEFVFYLLQRKSHIFDRNLLHEMQQFFIVSKEPFRAQRDARTMSRIICTHYYFRRKLLSTVRLYAKDKRFVFMKCCRISLTSGPQKKNVLGLIIGINFLRENEFLRDKHVLMAVKNYLSDVNVVEGSYIENRDSEGLINLMYLEIEKKNAADFSNEEMSLLRRELPKTLKDRVEHLVHPVFMPYNEEEIMRNILVLSDELKFIRDLPQVMISFDEQTDVDVSFTVVLLRVLKKGLSSIPDMFRRRESFLQYNHIRTKDLGLIRKKYTKEANIFRVRLPKVPFIREDHSLDMYKARQAIVAELVTIVGEFRDFNGGLLSKQHEHFAALKESLGDIGRHNEFLLENFFYSLIPMVMTTILDLTVLQTLFRLVLTSLEEGHVTEDMYTLRYFNDGNFIYSFIMASDISFKKEIEHTIEGMHVPYLNLATSFIDLHDSPCLGYVYRVADLEKGKAFEIGLFRALERWKRSKKQGHRVVHERKEDIQIDLFDAIPIAFHEYIRT
jgi:hypothetical protein